MKVKKSILLVALILVMMILFSTITPVKAATGSKWLGIKMLRNSGYGYQLAGANPKNVWKIYQRNGNETIYCLRGGPGFGSGDMANATPKEIEYTIYYDMKNPDSIQGSYRNALSNVINNTTNYKALLWLLDNCYVAPKTQADKTSAEEYKQVLLQAAADYADEEGIVEGYKLEYLTDDDIDAVQQLAVWHFTNPTGDYHVDEDGDFDFWLNTEANNKDSVYTSLSDDDIFDNGWDRAEACQVLFRYLVNTAKEKAPTYVMTPNQSTQEPVTIVSTTIKAEEQGDKLIIGPYKLQENGSMKYTFNASFTGKNEAAITNYTLLNGSKQAVASGTTIKDLIGENFYISVPKPTSSYQITLNINGSYFYSTATYWSVAENKSLDTNQPVVIVEKGNEDFSDSKTFTYEQEPVKEFDLALRKFITSIDGVAPTTSREPSISSTELNKLKNGTTETANKVHPKNALAVKTGSIVKYKIRVYNEGEVDGYATQVTDHLPAGLRLAQNSKVNTDNGWTNPSGDGKTIVTNALQNKLIPAFNGTTLRYEELEIECEVIAKVTDQDQTLKNVAEISEHKDKNGNTQKTGLDRDSQPGNVDHERYGETSQQDDDDFERLVLEGKYFDLSLRKFITNVTGNGTVANYSRAPQVDVSPLKNGQKTANYNHSKEPIPVEIGDVVTYTIRVYNEGQRDGYITEITDHLPTQLEFLKDDELNKKYRWEVSADGRTVTTDITSPNAKEVETGDGDLDISIIEGKTVKELQQELYGSRTTSDDKLLLKAFDGGNDLDYIDVQIRCRVKNNIDITKKITNIADITGFADENGNRVTDRDSQADNVTLPENFSTYQDKQIAEQIAGKVSYIPGQQDDDDFEKLVLKEFDLALRKFIISIDGVAPTASREPVISDDELTKLKNGTTETANKVHPKNALAVRTGSKVIYKIRVYNEGEVAGYATEVTDHLPAGLRLAQNSKINTDNGWTNPSGDGKTIVTNALQNKLIPAFDGSKLSYEDLEIECEVTAEVTQNDQTLRNVAEITKHKDKNGNENVKDRDSTPDNVNHENYQDKSQEDDDDFEKLVLEGKNMDLSLRKFITTVEHAGSTKNYDRAPKVDTTPLKDRSSTTAIYNHPKTPIGVDLGDVVIYTIRVYNEGQINGYVTQIKDHLPEQLEFIVNDELNAKYGWKVSEDGRTVTTDITSPNTTNTANRDSIYENRAEGADKVLLKAFEGGDTLDYIDVQIKCKVKEDSNLYEKITNIADIADFTDENGNKMPDRDSQANNVDVPEERDLPTYKDKEIEKEYVPGQQDDDDFEKLVLQRFDLALRKFITKVNETDITNRAPVFKKVNDTEYKYEHTKEPVEVANGNTVIYTLRIFNEGNIAGYAKEIKDNLPEGLEYLPEHETNKEYRWKMIDKDGNETDKVEEAVSIRTDYLSKEQEKEPGSNLINLFNPETMTMPDYKDVKIAFKVTEPNTSDRIIINTAEITDDSDEEGNPVEDIDSTPDNDEEGEDDIDIEKIKVKYFDLSLKKWVTESIVTYNGKTTVTKTGHTGDENPEPPAKVELRGSRMSKTTVKFKFAIKITNEGEIEGYAKEISDYIPQGLKFEAKDNPDWKEVDGKVVTDKLKDTLLQPGESATVEIILTWINNKNNLGEKVNWAEISKDENPYDSPDIDSTPNNQVKGEDDIDNAPVILSVSTGNAPTYITLAFASLSVLTTGVILIKKFVL